MTITGKWSHISRIVKALSDNWEIDGTPTPTENFEATVVRLRHRAEKGRDAEVGQLDLGRVQDYVALDVTEGT